MHKLVKSVGRSNTVVTEQPNNTQNTTNNDYPKFTLRLKPNESVKDEHTITGFTNEDYSNVFKDNSTQSTRKPSNFMDFTQNNQTVTPNKNDKYDQYLSNNTVQQSNLNRAITGILQNTVSDMSSVDYVSGGQRIIDDFTMQQMKPLDVIEMMEMENDESYKNVITNNVQLNKLNEKVKDKIVKEDDAKPLKLTTEQILSNQFDFADIITVDKVEHNINTLESLADYVIDDETIQNSPLLNTLRGNGGSVIADIIKEYIKALGKEETDQDYIVFLKNLLENMSDISSKDFLQYIKSNDLYSLLTILNHVITKEIPNGLRKKTTSDQLQIIGALIIKITIDYYEARRLIGKRNSKITEFNQLLVALQEVARSYVTTSPQFVQVVQALNTFFDQMTLLAQNDTNFQSLIHGVSSQLNNFIRNGTVSRENFDTITRNFDVLYEHYQNFYAQSVGEHTNVAAQFNKIQTDIDNIKFLFGILTNSSDPSKIAEAVATIHNTVKDLYYNKGFSEEQKQILLNIVNMIKDDNYNVAQQIKVKIETNINTMLVEKEQEITKKFEKEIEGIGRKQRVMSDILDNVKKFLLDLPNESATLPDILKGINSNIKKIESDLSRYESAIQENRTQMNNIATRIIKMEKDTITKEDFDNLSKKVSDLQTQNNEMKAQNNEQIMNMVSLLAKQSVQIGIMSMVLEEEYPEISEAISDFNSLQGSSQSTSTYNGRLTQFYSDFLSERERILNDLTRSVERGMTIRDYIDSALEHVNQIKNDDTTEIDESIIKNRDNKRRMAALLYISEVYETLLQYTGTGLSDKREKLENIFNQIRIIAKTLEEKDLEEENWKTVKGNLDILVENLKVLSTTIDSDTNIENVLKVRKTIHPGQMSELEKVNMAIRILFAKLKIINKLDGQMALPINGDIYKVDFDDLIAVLHEIIVNYYENYLYDYMELKDNLYKAPEKAVEMLKSFTKKLLERMKSDRESKRGRITSTRQKIKKSMDEYKTVLDKLTGFK